MVFEELKTCAGKSIEGIGKVVFTLALREFRLLYDTQVNKVIKMPTDGTPSSTRVEVYELIEGRAQLRVTKNILDEVTLSLRNNRPEPFSLYVVSDVVPHYFPASEDKGEWGYKCIDQIRLGFTRLGISRYLDL